MLEILKTYSLILHADKRGVTAVEYAVIAGMIVAVVAGAFTALGTGIQTTLTAVVTAM